MSDRRHASPAPAPVAVHHHFEVHIESPGTVVRPVTAEPARGGRYVRRSTHEVPMSHDDFDPTASPLCEDHISARRHVTADWPRQQVRVPDLAPDRFSVERLADLYPNAAAGRRRRARRRSR